MSGHGPDIIVQVDDDHAVSQPSRIESVVRSELPFALGGRMFLLGGEPAIRQITDCSTPAGSCPGMIGGLVVLNGSTLLSVFSQGYDQQATEQILASFRLVNPQHLPGCRFTVDSRGFGRACIALRG